MDWLVDILKTLNITPAAVKLLKILESVEEVDTLTDDETRLCMKLLVCSCDKRRLIGIKNGLGMLAKCGDQSNEVAPDDFSINA